MTELLQMLIENYDLSDIINQTVIVVLLVLLAAKANVRIRLRQSRFY